MHARASITRKNGRNGIELRFAARSTSAKELQDRRKARGLRTSSWPAAGTRSRGWLVWGKRRPEGVPGRRPPCGIHPWVLCVCACVRRGSTALSARHGP